MFIASFCQPWTLKRHWRALMILSAAVMSLGVLSSLARAELSTDLIAQYRAGPAFWPPFEVDPGVRAREIGPLPELEERDAQALIQLGQTLFFDPRLSASGQIACASCHDPELGWGDGRRVAFGHDRQTGTRNAMTLLNAGFFDEQFWDGRASGLEEQALHPIQDPLEMASDLAGMEQRLNAIPGYRQRFRALFAVDGREPKPVTAARVAQALAAFERPLVSRPSRFDRFAQGEGQVLSDQEIEGLHLFRTQARCMNCHHGPLFSDGQYHHTGLAYLGRKHEDLGRFRVTGDPADLGAFRTPSLRDLKWTGPWMHNGLFPRLDGILNMYNAGMCRAGASCQGPPLSPLIQSLGLERSQLAALEAFLDTLSQRPARIAPPVLPGATDTF